MEDKTVGPEEDTEYAISICKLLDGNPEGER
jgi:hypothetical protein